MFKLFEGTNFSWSWNLSPYAFSIDVSVTIFNENIEVGATKFNIGPYFPGNFTKSHEIKKPHLS